MRERYDDFQEAGAEILEVSVDSVHSQARWAQDLGGVPFPILADFHPKGAVAAAYGVYNADRGNARRSSFVIDLEGVIRHSRTYEPGSLPNPDELLPLVAGL